jgi:hypothetical protein
MTRWIAWGFAGLGLVGCGSGSASNGDDGGGRDGSSLADGSMQDDARSKTDGSKDGTTPDGTAKDGSSDGSKGDGGISDAPVGDAPFDATGGVQCYEVFGSGSGETCGYSYSNEPGFMCTGGLTPGTCPSAGLFGCCVDITSSGGTTSVAAVCYYSPDSGTISMSACTSPGEKWETTSP